MISEYKEEDVYVTTSQQLNKICTTLCSTQVYTHVMSLTGYSYLSREAWPLAYFEHIPILPLREVLGR